MNWGRANDTGHPTLFYSGDTGNKAWVVARHVVCVTRIQFTVWLELPKDARPIAVQEVAQDGLAAVLMVQPIDPGGIPIRSWGPAKTTRFIEPDSVPDKLLPAVHGFHGFLFVLIGDPIEEGHCTYPMGVVRAVPRFTHEPATYAVFYLGFSEKLPPDNNLGTSTGACSPAPGS